MADAAILQINETLLVSHLSLHLDEIRYTYVEKHAEPIKTANIKCKKRCRFRKTTLYERQV
jgi:hypothetical protein